MTGIGKSQGPLEKKHDERTKYLKSPLPLKRVIREDFDPTTLIFRNFES
jgi:hypothetical protein